MTSRVSHRASKLPQRPTVRLIILIILLAACIFGGGSSRPDVQSLLYLRPIAIAATFFFMWNTPDWGVIRPLLLMMAALAATYLLQLIPLPPYLYKIMPGRENLQAIEALNGTADHWRALTLDPDLTLNSILSLFVPTAILLGSVGLSRLEQRGLLGAACFALTAGAILGALQVSGGRYSPFYLYENTYPGYAVGWFSNRNHHAVALACLFPLLRVWTMQDGKFLRGRARLVTGITVAMMLLPLIVISGSRAGLVLGLLGLLTAALILPPSKRISRRTLAVVATTAFIILGFAAAMMMVGRAASLDRLLQSGDLGSEGRVAYIATEWQVLRNYWPLGTGSGGFDSAVRIFEPDHLLHTTFFNHAHNDFLEMVIVAGLPGIILVAAAMVLLCISTAAAFRHYRMVTPGNALARAGAATLWIMAAASLVDYPLRSPLMAAFAALAAVWLRTGIQPRNPPRVAMEGDRL